MTHALAYVLGGLFVLAAVRLDGWPLLLAAGVTTGALVAVLHLAQRQRLAGLLQTRTAAYVRGWTESRQEAGEPVPVHVTVTNRQTGAILFAGDAAKLPADLDLPQGGWSADDLVQPMADPLDESDHRPRHAADGNHVYRHGPNHWHSYGEDGLCDMDPAMDDPVRLTDFGPLTFCDCADDATIEAENGATD